MNLEILCVGRMKERFYREAAAEYEKRLTRYAKVTVRELPDEQTKENATERERELILKKEAEPLLRALKNDAYVISMEIDGQSLSSRELAEKLEALSVSGRSHIQFLIGGSLGLHPEVTSRADLHLSFSAMTFPHQLARVMLLEQLYRCFRIMKGEPYHK